MSLPSPRNSPPPEASWAARRRARPLRFAAPERALFGWYHPPVGGVAPRAGIVVCNTIGNESLRAYRIVRHWAEHLANAGFAALRFDFHATGDSSGDDRDPNRLSTWLEDVDLAIAELRARSGVAEIGLAGIRMGAMLATLAAARRDDVGTLALWEPCMTGSSFVTESIRQHKALQMLAPSGYTLDRPGGTEGGKEALGYFMSHQTLGDLERLSLSELNRKPAREVLVIGAADAAKQEPLLAKLRELGATTEYRQAAGYQHIFRNPPHSEVSTPVLVEITGWISTHHTATGAGNVHDAGIARPSGTGPAGEFPVFFGSNDELFGILASPETSRADRPAIIIVNAGVGTRIGPHRLYVRMARTWAKAGFHVLRIDLSGSGDSLRSPGQTAESEPYPERAIADIGCAMDGLAARTGTKRFIIAGICSGADLAFRAGIDDPRVAGSIVINPRSFETRNFVDLEEHVRAHYVKSTLSAKENWRKLLRFEAGFKGTLLRIFQVMRSASFGIRGGLATRAKQSASNGPARDVPAAYRRMLGRGGKTLLLVSDRDPGVDYMDIHQGPEMRALESVPGFKRINLNGADHLFTLDYARRAALDRITAYLLETF